MGNGKPSLDDQVRALMVEYPLTRSSTCKTGRSKNLALIEALSAQGALRATISRILKDKFDEHIDEQSIGRHLRRACQCPK